MNTEAKVGAFTLLGLGMLIGIVVFLSGINFHGQRDYQFKILYRQVTGLKVGAGVSLAGVPVGKVEDIKAQDNKVMVTVKVDGGTKIPKNALFTINSDGLMGEKFVSIIPPEKITEYVSSGEILVGTDERGLDYMMGQAGATMEQMQELMANMNKVIGNQKAQESLIQAAVNIQELTANMNNLVGVMSRVASANEGNVDSMIKDMTVAMKNVKDSSFKVEQMLNNLTPVLSDPNTAENLRKAINLAGSLSDRAEGAMSKLASIKSKTSVTAYYDNSKKHMRVDGDAYIYTDDNHFLNVGANDIGGEDSSADLQVGIKKDKIIARGGIIQSKLGVGLDYKASDGTTITTEVYNPKDPKVNIGAEYRLKDNLALVGQVQGANRRDMRTTYVGFKQDF